ncbi:hypothetical protein ACQRIT_000565 [Beauveria bassiana]
MERDIIAYIYPCGDHCDKAKEVIEANWRCVGPRLIEVQHSRCGRGEDRERQSTEPPQDSGASFLDYLPSLVVRFGDIPRTDKGLLFAWPLTNSTALSSKTWSLSEELKSPTTSRAMATGGLSVGSLAATR